jgi:hypothetical protein
MYNDTFSPPTVGGNCAKSPEKTIFKFPKEISEMTFTGCRIK